MQLPIRGNTKEGIPEHWHMALAEDHQWLRLWSKSSTRRLGLNARFAAEQTTKQQFKLSNRRPLSYFDGIIIRAIANAHETLTAKASKLRRTLALMPRASPAKQSLRRRPFSRNLISLCFAWKFITSWAFGNAAPFRRSRKVPGRAQADTSP